MLSIDLQHDEDLKKVCEQFISSMLPHENYKSSCLTTNLLLLFQYIHLDEFHLEHYVLLSVLNQLAAVKSSLDFQSQEFYEPRLTRKQLENYLETFIPDSINLRSIAVSSWLNSEGLQSNLSIPQAREQAQQKLYARVMDLYDSCFEMAIESTSVLELVPTLKQSLRYHVAMVSISTQATILQSTATVGRKTLSGSEDWLTYTQEVTSELSARLTENEDRGLVVLDSVEKANKIFTKLELSYDVISTFGIAPIDNGSPLMSGLLTVIVGQENVGKTAFAIGNVTIRALLEGKTVCYMHSETTKDKILVKLIISYVFQKYNTVITLEHVLHPESSPEHIQKMIGFAKTFLTTSGRLMLREAYNYATVYEEMLSDYNVKHFDILVIDHSCALVGAVSKEGRSIAGMTANVNALSFACVRFKNRYPVSIVVLSHPASDTKKAIASNKDYENSPTKYSQNLSTDADDLYILTASNSMRANNMAEIEVRKRRDAPIIAGKIVLNAEYHVFLFVYRPENQATESRASATAISVLEDFDRSIALEQAELGLFTEGD